MDKKTYDVIIIGAGPAGLTAGIYAGRYMLKTLIIGELTGGAISEAHKVCNFPSHKDINGVDLSLRMVEQAKECGAELRNEVVESVTKGFLVKTAKESFSAKKIIIASGRKKQKLNVPGEDNLKGVSYCATCDGRFYKNKVVAVVGGSNSALTASLLLAEYATKVYIIYRKERFFRPEPAWIKLADNNPKIEYLMKRNIIEIQGAKSVERIILDDASNLNVDGVFVEIGSVPDKRFTEQLGLKTKDNYVVVDNKQKTNIRGVFAAGDITNNPLKQAITACGEGAIAAFSAYEEQLGGKNGSH